MEEKGLSLHDERKEDVNKLLNDKVAKTDNVKTAIDILTTREALQKEGTIEKLVDEKEEELRNDAEAKRVQAETEKISREVEKVQQEKAKQLAELDKEISAKEKEVEKLKAEADKAQTFFESNEDILSCIGIRSKKTLKVMYGLMIPAIIIFVLIRFIALPLTVGGKLVEIMIDIVGGICNAIKNSALKIVIGILVVLLLVGAYFGIYYLGGETLILGKAS